MEPTLSHKAFKFISVWNTSEWEEEVEARLGLKPGEARQQMADILDDYPMLLFKVLNFKTDPEFEAVEIADEEDRKRDPVGWAKSREEVLAKLKEAYWETAKPGDRRIRVVEALGSVMDISPTCELPGR